MDEFTNKIKVWNFREKNEQSASASVIGQRPNFTITYCSASADCEKCSFGHCLLDLTLYNLKTTLILSPQLVIMSWKMLLNHWILYFPSPNSYEDYRIGLVIHSLPNLFRSFTWPDDIKYWRKASQFLCSWVTVLAFSVNNSTNLKDILPFWEYTEPIWNHSEHSEVPFYSKQITGRELIFGSTFIVPALLSF